MYDVYAARESCGRSPSLHAWQKPSHGPPSFQNFDISMGAFVIWMVNCCLPEFRSPAVGWICHSLATASLGPRSSLWKPAVWVSWWHRPLLQWPHSYPWWRWLNAIKEKKQWWAGWKESIPIKQEVTSHFNPYELKIQKIHAVAMLESHLLA